MAISGNLLVAGQSLPSLPSGPASDPCRPVAAASVGNSSGSAQALSAQGLQGARQLGNGFAGALGAPTVAVIDDFVTDSDGFNHGQEIAGIIQGQGVNAVRLNIDNGGSRDAAILQALDNVLGAVRQGQHFDAVNLSQQNFQGSQVSGAISQRIQALQSFGVPVVVAAGNGGAGARNTLANGAAFVVENADAFGNRAADSGVGNVRASGRFTSQAAATVAAQVALQRSRGF